MLNSTIFLIVPILNIMVKKSRVSTKEIVPAIASETDLSQKKVTEVLNLLLDHIHSKLTIGTSVSLYPLGTFKIVKRKGRKIRNPYDKQEMYIPDRTGLKFVPSALSKRHFNVPTDSSKLES